MRTRIQLGNIGVLVVRKDIKNVHLSVHPPTGRVRIAAPERMSLNTLRVFAIAKLPWIKKQQRKLLEQERETPREYIDRESHYVWGERTTWLRGARCTDPEAMPEMEARPPAENRHGGAPRGERPASWDAPHPAGCG